MSDSSEQKTDPASERKLQKAREKGSVAQSVDLSSFSSLILSLVVLVFVAQKIVVVMGQNIESAFSVLPLSFEDAIQQSAVQAVQVLVVSAAPILSVALFSGILVKLIFQRGVTFAVEPLIPKMDKLSPAKALKRIFGMRGWIELGTAFSRLLIWISAFAGLVYMSIPNFFAATRCDSFCIAGIALETLILFIIFAMIVLAVFAMVDALVQKFIFAHEQKMTKTEVKQERKDQFGSSEVRAARERFRKDLMESVESAGVENATFCLFFRDMCVAIRYHPEYAPVPIVTAKGLNQSDSDAIRDYIYDDGWKELEHEKLVLALSNRPIGVTVPEKFYGDLGMALTEMYS